MYVFLKYQIHHTVSPLPYAFWSDFAVMPKCGAPSGYTFRLANFSHGGRAVVPGEDVSVTRNVTGMHCEGRCLSCAQSCTT